MRILVFPPALPHTLDYVPHWFATRTHTPFHPFTCPTLLFCLCYIALRSLRLPFHTCSWLWFYLYRAFPAFALGCLRWHTRARHAVCAYAAPTGFHFTYVAALALLPAFDTAALHRHPPRLQFHLPRCGRFAPRTPYAHHFYTRLPTTITRCLPLPTTLRPPISRYRYDVRTPHASLPTLLRPGYRPATT